MRFIANIKQAKNCFLFKHLSEDDFTKRITDDTIYLREYSRGDEINNKRDYIGVIIRGKINAIYYQASGKRVILNRLGEGEVFGIVNLFVENNEKLSSLEADEDSEVLFISSSLLIKWLQSDELLLRAYMSFTHGKISFLNNRIGCFTHDLAYDRVKEYLEKEKDSDKNMSMTELADFLGISRASLYRALNQIKDERF